MLSSPAILFLVPVGGQGGAVCLFVLGMLVVLLHYVCGVFSSLFFFLKYTTCKINILYSGFHATPRKSRIQTDEGCQLS